MASSIQHTRVAAPSYLTLATLEHALQAADAAVVLAPSRILRRVIKQTSEIRGMGLRAPHRKCFVIARSALAAIVEQRELRLPDLAAARDVVVLLPQPTAEFLAETPPPKALSKYWRLLFHARVHQAFDDALAQGRLTAADVEDRIARLGQVEFEEARAVLRQEDLLLPPKNDISTYIEFAAVYLDVRYFAGSFMPAYFANLRDLERVDELLREDIDAKALFQATRPAGACEQPWRGDLSVEEADDARHAPRTQSATPSPWRFQRLTRRADRAAAAGNLVGAAIARMRAAALPSPITLAKAAPTLAPNCSDWPTGSNRRWASPWPKPRIRARSLAALLDVGAQGVWSPESRLLYDLQKVCVDHERGVYALDIPRWIKTFGRAPLKRPLPGQRDVLMSKHLGAAKNRLHAARVSPWVRSRLERLVQAAIERTAEQLRARFRPKIEVVLDRVRLTPKNAPETVARRKLVDELLDRVAARGFIAMGDLRDGLSRNNLKLPDLTSGRQFLFGDQLLRADTLLADSLDEIYRHGEIYLRWPQRISSLAFGLPLGRLLTRHVALPFGGAFLAIKFFEHLINMVRGHLLDLPELVPDEWFTCLMVAMLGAFLWGLFHRPGFRRGCLALAHGFGKLLRRALMEWPARVLELPQVLAIAQSRAFRWSMRYAFKPLAASGLLLAVTDLLLRRQPTARGMALMFMGVNLLINSRLGRNVDELLTDLAVESWRRFRIHVVAAMFRLIVEVFNRLLEGLERLLYAVDEWLRFRAGEGPWSTAVKSVTGVVWAFVHYFIRLCVTLLIEPQLNPIKHFPVVTVAHKVIFPVLSGWLLDNENKSGWFYFIVLLVTLLLPGVFGFLVWELKENWRLYAANRRPNLEPVAVGHHGETVLQLLKLGFRSGTIPKHYAKLRRASRKAFWSGHWRAVRKQRDALEHVEESLRRLVDRELLALLQTSRGWGTRAIRSGEIHLSSNRITIELRGSGRPGPGLRLDFADRGGLLVAGLEDRNWLAQLPESARRSLEDALAGFYKIAGVHLVRQQFEARAPVGAAGYEFLEAGLLVRMRPDYGPARFYPLKSDWAVSELVGDGAAQIMAAAQCPDLVFALNAVSWRRWVTIWQGDDAAVNVPPAPTGAMTLLPT